MIAIRDSISDRRLNKMRRPRHSKCRTMNTMQTPCGRGETGRRAGFRFHDIRNQYGKALYSAAFGIPQSHATITPFPRHTRQIRDSGDEARAALDKILLDDNGLIPFPVDASGIEASGRHTAYSECLVSADLLRKGYEVYRPLSPTCRHDLLAVRDGVTQHRSQANRDQRRRLRANQPAEQGPANSTFWPSWARTAKSPTRTTRMPFGNPRRRPCD